MYPCNGTVCHNSISLQSAAQHGEISTIPLTAMIINSYPQFQWVAFLVELFIVVSITVSYLTIGAVLHHTLKGWVKSFWTKDHMAMYREKLRTTRRCSCCTSQCMCNTILSLSVFGVVFSIAMLDPQGFLDMLEKFASLMINLEVTVFVFLMLLKSRNKENIKLKIPVPLPPFVYHLIFIIPLYFGFAVGYDIYNTIRDIVIEQSGASQGKVITQGITGVVKNITDIAIHNLTTILTTVAPSYTTVLVNGTSTEFHSDLQHTHTSLPGVR